MQAVISKSLINSLKPSEKPFEVRDTRTPGLLLRVQPTGVMTYYLEFSRGRRLKIGPVSVPIDDARDVAAVHLGSVAQGKDPKRVAAQAKGLTFLHFIEQEYEPWVTQHLRTADKLLQRLKSTCRRFHNKRLEHVTAAEVEKWRTERLKAGKKRGTVNRDLDDVRGVLSKAVLWGFLEVHPLAGLKKLPTDRIGVVRFLTTEEELRLFEELDTREQKLREGRDSANEWRKVRGHPLFPTLHNQAFADHLKPMVIISLHTGMRQGELFDLEWRDVDLSMKRITIRGEKAKSGQTRYIPLNAPCYRALTDWRNQCPDDAERVFPGKNGGRLDNVKFAWNKALATAKVIKFRWHDMRHTFASRLVMKGVDLNTVRELMGHADYQMTLRYAHLAPEHKAEAVAKLA